MPCEFAYDFKDLSITLPPLESTIDNDNICISKEGLDKEENRRTTNDICCESTENGPNFDILLSKLWDNAKGFRYPYRHLPFKILKGQYQFIAQLNTDRAEKRREPQCIQSLNQPFSSTSFNFNKVNPDEIILELKPWYQTILEKTDGDGEVDDELVEEEKQNEALKNEKSQHKILINVSPFEYGNVLLVPFLSSNQPQRVTKPNLRLALDMMLLSRSRNFRVGFNSLCAFASVNHSHYHGYYLNHRLYLEHAELKELKGPCYEICDYPAPAFVFVLDDASTEQKLDTFVQNAYKLISYLQTNNFPHNLYFLRGSSRPQHFDTIRLFVWARSPSYGAKVSGTFNPALCEFAGHLSIKTEPAYGSISEEVVKNELRQPTAEVFHKIRNNVEALFSN